MTSHGSSDCAGARRRVVADIYTRNPKCIVIIAVHGATETETGLGTDSVVLDFKLKLLRVFFYEALLSNSERILFTKLFIMNLSGYLSLSFLRKKRKKNFVITPRFLQIHKN